MNETYHSTHGAITESQHVFIKEGLQHYCGLHKPVDVRILEVGFGTGLNALLSLKEASDLNVTIHYTTLEPFPLTTEIFSELNFCDNPILAGFENMFAEMHNSLWEESVEMTNRFSLHKSKVALQDFDSLNGYDLIYFDAFAPSKQAEMWEPEVLGKVRDMMNSNAILVTYCARGQFKRDLSALGFKVETLDGPPGKKEMVRAMKV